MNTRSLLTSAAATSLLLVSAAAQTPPCGYEPNIGAPLGLGDDTIASSLALGFNYTFPDGTVTGIIDVDSNGRILLPGGDTSDYSQSVAELLAESSSICPYWDDLNPGDALSDDVYFNALSGKAVITWKDIVTYNGTAPFTFQVTLWADGRTWFFYDSRTPAQDCIVGMSAGNGAADPGPIDLSPRPFPTTGTTFYEQFSAFDLAGQLVEAINITSNYILTGGNCASASRIGQTCMPVFSMLFAPDGSGGYVISRSTSGTWSTAYGTSLGLGDDTISAPQPLGFPFTFPGGVATTDIEVDSNGRVLVPGSDTSDLSPSLAELLTEAHPTLAPFWTDLNANLGGDVLFGTSTGVPVITWLGVPQYGSATTSHSFQVQLYPGDAFRFSYLATSTFDPAIDNLLVGISGGNGAADPGESDLTAMLPISTAGGTTAYEYFDGAVSEYCDFTASPFSLDATSRPVINTAFGLDVTNLPANSVAAFFLLGFSNPNQDLGSLGLGLDACFLYSSAEATILSAITAGTASLSLNIPNNPSLAGGQLFIQSAVVTPGANLLNLLFSNGVQVNMNSQ